MPAKRHPRTAVDPGPEPPPLQARAATGRRKPAIAPVRRSKKPPLPRATKSPDRKLTQIVHEKLLRAITGGALDLGEPLSENDLARALGVSKAPVRESLNELRLEGLVVVVPQSGSYVFSPTVEQIEQLCDFRSLLESRALRASMEREAKSLIADLRKCTVAMKRTFRNGDLIESKRHDTEFHRAIIRHSGNDYLVQSYTHIGHSVEALRYRLMNAEFCREQVYAEHQKIVNLLAGGQVVAAIAVLKDHIARTKQFQASVSWPGERQRRKDYRFRDYSTILAETRPLLLQG